MGHESPRPLQLAALGCLVVDCVDLEWILSGSYQREPRRLAERCERVGLPCLTFKLVPDGEPPIAGEGGGLLRGQDRAFPRGTRSGIGIMRMVSALWPRRYRHDSVDLELHVGSRILPRGKTEWGFCTRETDALAERWGVRGFALPER